MARRDVRERLEALRRHGRRSGPLARDRGRRVPRPGRAVRVRQEHRAADARRPGAIVRGPDHHRRPRRQQRRAGGPRRGDGLPDLRALPAHDRVRQPRLRRSRNQRLPEARDRRARVASAGEVLQLDELLEAQAEAALRRPAAAGGARPGDRARAGRLPDGRAAFQPRRASSASQTRAEILKLQRAARDDDDLRHPRPGRGDDDGRPDRGHERGRPPAGRHAAGALHDARPTSSSPASSARRR